MKKLYILLLLIVTVSFNLKAVTYTSVQNGNWMNFTTWSPVGVPIPGDIIIINTNVTLDTSFAYTSGSITVNSGASLVQDFPVRDIWLNGPNASLTNNGTTTIRYLLLSIGSYTNSGDFNVKSFANYITANNTATGVIIGVDSLYNDGTIINDGTVNVMAFFNNNTINNYGIIQGLVTVVDSMFNVGTFLNDAGALLRADSFTNTGQFTNNGVVNFDQFTNTGTFINTDYMSFVDMTNTGTFTNQDSLIGTISMWNTGNFDNQNGAVIDLGVSLLNADFVSFNAVFNNDGLFNIGDSYYNYDAVTGGATGSFIMQDTSFNNTGGTMTGSFDFCDMTPPATSPFIDINLGTVDPNITYCTITGVTEMTDKLEWVVYPNPTTGILNIELEDNFTVDVYNVLGELIITSSAHKIDLTSFQNGIYFVLIKDEKGETIKHKKIVKH
ncbi:MAG: hypothetical protein COA97_07540 [Flavobacteriales bacterium]|nr:MAG: hypothetical protein COA97_07540 [Flavobacteriales bacterium]